MRDVKASAEWKPRGQMAVDPANYPFGRTIRKHLSGVWCVVESGAWFPFGFSESDCIPFAERLLPYIGDSAFSAFVAEAANATVYGDQISAEKDVCVNCGRPVRKSVGMPKYWTHADDEIGFSCNWPAIGPPFAETEAEKTAE